MTSIDDTFLGILKTNGHSITRSRRAVFEALVGQEPMSMHELVEQVRGVDRASVYRAVDLFEKLSIVQRLNTGWKYKIELTDKFTHHHHHLTCTKCQATIAMNELQLEHFIDQIAHAHGFEPESHQIEIQGLCKSCRNL